MLSDLVKVLLTMDKYLIRINFGAEKIWHNWRKMAKIAKLIRAKCNFFLAAPN